MAEVYRIFRPVKLDYRITNFVAGLPPDLAGWKGPHLDQLLLGRALPPPLPAPGQEGVDAAMEVDAGGGTSCCAGLAAAAAQCAAGCCLPSTQGVAVQPQLVTVDCGEVGQQLLLTVPDGMPLTVTGATADSDKRWRHAGGIEEWQVRAGVHAERAEILTAPMAYFRPLCCLTYLCLLFVCPGCAY